MSNSAPHLIKQEALAESQTHCLERKGSRYLWLLDPEQDVSHICVQFPLSLLRSEDISIHNAATCVAPSGWQVLKSSDAVHSSCDVHSSSAFESSTKRHFAYLCISLHHALFSCHALVGLGGPWSHELIALPEAPQLRRRLNLSRLKELAEPQATERNNSRHKTIA